MVDKEKIKTAEEVAAEVNELSRSIIGKINGLDSKNDRINIIENLINTLVAGVELSRIEKVGILYTVTSGRVKDRM